MNTALGRILHFPLIKIIVGIVICLGTMFLFKKFISQPILYKLIENKSIADAVKNSISFVIVLVSYILFSKYYERRVPVELSIKYLPKEMFGGFALGFLTISVSIFILFLLGFYKIVAISTSHYSVRLFTILLAAALIEDLLIRGLIIRVLEKWVGTYITLIIAMVLELQHVFNPNTNSISIIFYLVWGFTMAMLFIYTKRIWLPFFFHLGWNFSQPFYGSNLTGLDNMGSIIQSEFSGPAYLTGSEMGIESSIFTIILLLLIGIVLLYLVKRDNKIIKRKKYFSKRT